MAKYEATWRLNWFDAFLANLDPLHINLRKIAEAHNLKGTIKREGRCFYFDLRGTKEDCEGFDKSLKKVRNH